jgi:hypothetical protein
MSLTSPRRLALALPGAALCHVGAVAAACVAGLVCASGEPVLVAVLLAALFALVVLRSRRHLLPAILAGALLIVGSVQLYAPQVRYVKYVLPVMAAVLLLHALRDRIGAAPRPPSARAPEQGSAVVAWALAFIAIACASMALAMVENRNAGLIVLGVRDYFIMWSVFFALALARWRPQDRLDALPFLLLAVALLQLPFVAHQYYFLVPLREGLGGGIVPVDIVAGTFGASLFGGGANAVLALFMFMVSACLLALWKSGALPPWIAFALSFLLLSPVFVNEAKVSAIYLPVVFFMLFSRDLFRRPLRFLAAGAVGLGLLALLLSALTAFHPSGELRKWTELVELTVAQQTSHPSERQGQWSELTRVSAITFWAEEQLDAHPVHILFGHGPGASRVQNAEEGVRLARTLAEKRYGGMRIGYTAISALLWDTGVLGVGAVLGLLLAAYRSAATLARASQGRDAFRAGLFDGIRVAAVLLLISLFHKDFLVFHLPFQTLFLVLLGYLVACERALREAQRSAAADAHAMR